MHLTLHAMNCILCRIFSLHKQTHTWVRLRFWMVKWNKVEKEIERQKIASQLCVLCCKSWLKQNNNIKKMIHCNIWFSQWCVSLLLKIESKSSETFAMQKIKTKNFTQNYHNYSIKRSEKGTPKPIQLWNNWL